MSESHNSACILKEPDRAIPLDTHFLPRHVLIWEIKKSTESERLLVIFSITRLGSYEGDL